MNGSKDGAHHRAGDGDFRQLEYDGTGMTQDARPGPDQLELELIIDQSAMATGRSLQQIKAASL